MRRNLPKPMVTKKIYYLSKEKVIRSISESLNVPIQCLCSKGSDRVTLIFDPNSMREIIHHLHWNDCHPDNVLETAFALVGQELVDPNDNSSIIIVRFIAKTVAKKRSRTFVSTENFSQYYSQALMLNDNLSKTPYAHLAKFGNLEVVGTSHTHPDLKGIDVKPSSVDVEEHMSRIEYPEHNWITQILDPIRCLSAAYVGKDMIKPTIYYLFYPDDMQLFQGQKSCRISRFPSVTIPRCEVITLNESESQELSDGNAESDSLEDKADFNEQQAENEMVEEDDYQAEEPIQPDNQLEDTDEHRKHKTIFFIKKKDKLERKSNKYSKKSKKKPDKATKKERPKKKIHIKGFIKLRKHNEEQS